MKMKIKIIIALACFTQSVHVLAVAPIPIKPSACPSVAALQAATFSTALLSHTGNWNAMIYNNNFSTTETWSLAMAQIVAKDEKSGLRIANKSLQGSITPEAGGPRYVSTMNFWVCGYNNPDGYQTFTVTPPYSPTSNLLFDI